MAIKFLYIDDEQDEVVAGIKNNLSTAPDKLVVVHEKALSWNHQISRIKKGGFDGLLLDLKLEFTISEAEMRQFQPELAEFIDLTKKAIKNYRIQLEDSHPQTVNNINSLIEEDYQKLAYYAPELAQAIRTLTKKEDIVDIPIFLCSTDENFMQYFDKTGTDLFDEIIKKEDISPEKIDVFTVHSQAYKTIKENENKFFTLLNSDAKELEELKLHFDKLKTVHEKAFFIYKQILQPSGTLIDEELLAIRLGVDKQNSEDWDKLRAELEEFQYKGIYSSICKRWWMTQVYEWWRRNFPTKSMQNTSAKEKVEQLKIKFGFANLSAIIKPEYHQYDSFWHKCKKSSLPLEAADGIRCLDEPRYSWQNPQYVSLNYIWNSTLDQQSDLRELFSPIELKKIDEIIQKRRNHNP